VDVGRWLERVFHMINSLKGDSPKIAGLIDLLHTQGMWDASARLAFLITIAESLDEEPLSEEDVQKLAAVFEDVFTSHAASLFPQGAQSFAQADRTQLDAFRRDVVGRIQQEAVWTNALKQRVPAF